MRQRTQMVSVDMVKNLIFLYASFNPSLVDNATIHVVTLSIGDFLPNLTVISVFKDHIVCLWIGTDDSSSILDQLSTNHLNNFYSCFFPIYKRVFHYSECSIVKKVLFDLISWLKLFIWLYLNFDDLRLELCCLEQSLLNQTLFQPLNRRQFHRSLISSEGSFGWCRALHSLRVHSVEGSPQLHGLFWANNMCCQKRH